MRLVARKKKPAHSAAKTTTPGRQRKRSGWQGVEPPQPQRTGGFILRRAGAGSMPELPRMGGMEEAAAA